MILRRMATTCLLYTLLTISYTTSAFDMAKTVIKMPLAEGISMDDAIDSLKLRANALNMKLVGHQPLSEELKAMGEPAVKRMEIFQFCDPKIAKAMVEYNMDFAAYLPCRITLVEDDKGKGWLVMMDLDPFIQAAKLPPKLQKKALKIRDSLKQIIMAGVNGEL